MNEVDLSNLNNEVKKLKQQVKIISDAQEDDRESIIRDILKQTSLYTRFKVFLEMQYLNILYDKGVNKNNSGPASDQEFKEAHDWACDTTEYLVQSFLRWEDDERPALYPDKK